ncbi:MAG: DUF4136 domain-containing protein [Paucibacter sp.]|nr:DUF4136 domain-containing protein [Roseateles sp.]
MDRRQLLLGLACAPLTGLVACTGPYIVSSTVVSYGEWPADRKPGTFAFDRLPSQKSGEAAERANNLEGHAIEALEKAGFTPVAEGAQADVLVTLGVRLSLSEAAIWDDPLWWHWRGGWRRGYWYPGPVGMGGPFGRGYYPYDPLWDRRFTREAAVLIRDRASGTALYEGHACNDGINAGDEELIHALFLAALSGFPNADGKPHQISVQMPGQSPAPAKP